MKSNDDLIVQNRERQPMSLGFEINLCRNASDRILRIYEQGLFGFPCPDLPREKKYLVPRPLTGTYTVNNVESLGAKVVASFSLYWLVDVELHIEWCDGTEERPAVHRICYGYDERETTIIPLHRVPYIGWDVSESLEIT